jgi:TP901 family phage tail tape measure protein
MAEENLVTRIVARSDFSDLIGDLNKVSSRLVALQQQLNSTNKTLAVQAANMQKAFASTLRSTGQFSSHFVSLSSDVDKFGKSLDSGKMKLGQYYQAWQQHAKTSGGLVRDLAKQQVQMQNAILQPLGKNAQGLMQFNVHVPRGLDVVKNKAALARQEMMIMNKVIQDGANQVINWGKNTQWAGRQLTVGLTLPIAMFGKAASDAFKEADEQLVRLTKVYGGVAATSAQELGKIRKEVSATARELSSAYGASYKETIGLAADIAATGKQGKDLIDSTKETTRLSILGEVDRQEAMKATLAIQTAFKKNTTELAESINFLNAVENQTSTSLADLVEAIPKAGPVVKSLGGDVEDLALYLTAMREGGINASEGANALKSALASIINPTKVAKEMFTGFGINLEGIVTKNAGNLTVTILEIQKALETLDPLQKSKAIEQLFGKFQFARMNALFENLGKQGSQTLQVLDLMKASSADLANIAGRELAQITESASGKYKRALETLKADMAGVGEQFLNVGTKLINVIDGVLKFFNKLPDPIKNILGFVAGLTALTGPIIMLTGLMANFFGYIAKGLFHFKALIKGGQGFKLLTPELLAAEKAGSLLETTFYDDAKAAAVLKQSITSLIAELSVLEVKANSARVAVGPAVRTLAGGMVVEGAGRVANPEHPLIGKPYSRSFAHLNPVAGMTADERMAQTIFGVAPNPGPLNQRIGKNPQIYMTGDMPLIEGLTSVKGSSTGIVAQEAAKWHSMTAALAMQSKSELGILKREVLSTGTITSELSSSYTALLPHMTDITKTAAREAELIVGQLQAGKLTVEQARAKIISLNAQVDTMMSQTAAQVAAAQGRTISVTTVPLTSQPVVDPNTGKSNMKELFHKGPTATLVDKVARALGVRTSGGGYSIETTRPIRRNQGGKVYDPSVHGNVVPGDTSIKYDNTPAILREGGFVLNQDASRNNPDLVSMAQNANNEGGRIVPALLTPGETYFPPEMASSMMPMLQRANGGSKITLRNLGGMVGGRVSPNTFNYGTKPGFMTYPQLKAALQAIVGTKTGSKTILNYMRRPKLSAGVLKATPQTIDEMLGIPLGKGQSYNEFGHIVNAKGEIAVVGKVAKPATAVYGDRSESANKALSGEGLVGNQYNDFLRLLLNYGKGSILGSTSQLFNSIPKGIATKKLLNQIDREISSRYIRELFRMKRAGTALKDENNPYHDISSQVLKELAPKNKHLQNIWGQWSTSTSAVNPHYINEMKKGRGATSAGARDIELINPKTGERFIVPALKGSGDSVAYHAANKDWESKYAYDVTRNWPKKEQHYGMGHQYNLFNQDPLHGPIQIGNATKVHGSTAGEVSKLASYSDKFGRMGFMDVGGANSDPVAQAQYLVRRYMAGDTRIMAQMAYETKNKLNAHPLSIQSKLQAVSKKYTGELFRGITGRALGDNLPPHIVKAIELAKTTGDASELIGKEFIMRRASFSSDPTVASYFSGFGKDGLVIQALLKNRNVTPVSELNPDVKFTAPYGQQWGSSVSGNMMSEKESLVGGKFRIKDFKDGKLVVETVGIEAREKGGDVNAGQPYLVGEKGPELFVPRNSGGIIPNSTLGGMVRSNKNNYGQLGPMRVEKFTTTGRGGVRTNAYGMVGSPAYLPALGLPGSTAINATGDKMSQIFWQKLFKPVDHQLYKIGESLKGSAGRITSAFSRIQSSVNTGVTALNATPPVRPVPYQGIINATTLSRGDKVYPNPMPRYFTGVRSQPFDTMPLPYQVDQDGNKIKYSKFAGDKGAIFRRSSAMLSPSTYLNSATRPRMTTGFRAGGMGTWMGGGIAGGAAGGFIGKKMGGESGGAIGTMIGGLALPMMIQGLSSLSIAAAAAGTSMGALLSGMAVAAAPFVAVAAVVAGLTYGFIKYKKHLEDVGQANRAVFGATKETMQEVGLSYKSNTQSLKDYMEQAKLARTAGVNAYNQSTNAGGSLGLTLTIDQLRKGVEDAKKNAKETISNINNVGDKDAVVKLAASMKQQYISAGMSVQDATNKVYTLIKASEKGAYAFAAVTSKAFTSIKDQSTAATYAVNILVREMKAGSVNAEEMAVGIDNMLSAMNAYQNSLIGTKDKNGDIVDEQEAQLLALDKIVKTNGAWNNVSEDVLDQIRSQDLLLGSVLNKNESLVSIYAKQSLLRGGFEKTIDIFGLGEAESVKAARGMAVYQAEVSKAVLDTKGPLGGLNDLYNKTTTSIDNMTKAAESYGKATKYDKIIKDQNNLIKKIKEETDARLKALDAQKATADFTTQIKKEQLAYQAAIQSGDMFAAAQAQLKRVKAAEAKITAAEEEINKKNLAEQAAQTAATNKLSEQTAIATFRETVNSIAGSFVDVNSLDKEDRQSITGQLRTAIDALKASGGEAAKYASTILKGYGTSADEGKQSITPELKFLDALNDIGEKNAKDSKFGPAVDVFLGAVEVFAAAIGELDLNAKLGTKKNPLRLSSLELSDAQQAYQDEVSRGVKVTMYKDDNKTLSDAGRRAIMEAGLVQPGQYFTVNGISYRMRQGGTYGQGLSAETSNAHTVDGKIYELVQQAKATGGKIDNYAMGGKSKGSYVPGQGGYIRGEGTPTSDSIILPVGNGGIIRASDTEFMQPANAVSYYGTDFMEDIRARRIPREILGRFNRGGALDAFGRTGIPINSVTQDVIPNYAVEQDGYKSPITKVAPKRPQEKDYKNKAEFEEALKRFKAGNWYTTPKGGSYEGDNKLIYSEMGTLKRFLDVAKSQLGNHGYGSRDQYQKWADVEAPSMLNKYNIWSNKENKIGSDLIYWCGAFVAWVAANSGVKLSKNMFSAFRATNDYKSKGEFNDASKKKNLQPGDVVWYDFAEYETPGKPDHAAIVKKLEGDKLSTINGGSMDGQVWEQQENINKAELYGFVRPNFKSPTPITMGGTVMGSPSETYTALSGMAMGGMLPRYANGGSIRGYATAGKINPFGMGMEWFGNTLFKAGNSVVKNVFGFDATTPFSKKSNMEKLSMALLPLGMEGAGAKAGARGLAELSPYMLKRGSDGMDIVSDYILATRGRGTDTVVDGWSNVVHKPGSSSELFSIGNTAGPTVTRDLLALSLMLGAKGGGVGRKGINFGASADRSLFAESLVSKLNAKGLGKVVSLPAKEEASVGSEKVEALSWMYGHLNMLNSRAKWGPEINDAAAISNEALGISKSGLSMLMRGKYDRDNFLDLLNAFNVSMKGHKGFANGGVIPGYSLAGKIKNVFKLGGKGALKIGGKGALAGAVWQGMEEAEKFLSLKYGADESDSGIEKWGKAFARLGFNALQGGVSGASVGKGPGFVGGSIYGTLEGLVGLIKDGSQYGVKGGSDYTNENLLKRKDLTGAHRSRYFNSDGGAYIDQIADHDLAQMSLKNSLGNIAKTGLISSILPAGLGGLRSAANAQAAIRQGVRVFDRRLPKSVNDLMELGFLNPTKILTQRNNILTRYQEFARNSMGEFPEILAGKGAVNIFGPRGYAAMNVDQILLKNLIFNRGAKRWVNNMPAQIAAFLNPFNKAAKKNNYSAHVPHDSNEVIMPGWESSLSPEALLKMPANTLSEIIKRGRSQAHALQQWGHSGSPNTLFHELGHRQLNIMGGTKVLRSWATDQATRGAHGLHEGFADLFEHGAYSMFTKAGKKTALKDSLGIGDTYVSNPGNSLLEDMLWRLNTGLNSGRMHQMGTEFLVPYVSMIKDRVPKETLRKLLAMIRVEGANLKNGDPKTQVQALYDNLSDKLPKFHDGGQVNTRFAGGEMMALLKDKEHVLTPDQMSVVAGSGGTTQISYTIAPVIHATEGMDAGALVNMATRQVMSELNYINKNNNATMGRPEMRVIK